MALEFVHKYPTDGYDVLISYTNEDETIAYIVASVNSITCVNRSSQANSKAEMIDADLTDFSGNQVILWLKKDGGTAGQIHDVTVVSTMTTGQTITKVFEIQVI